MAKLLVAGLLIGWLMRSGALNWAALGVFIEKPGLLVLDGALFCLGSVIGVLRYRTLLRITKVHVPFMKLFALQLTAFFFNLVIPGNIGGDVLKAIYVTRDAPAEQRTTIFMLAFVERLLGVVALILVGMLIVLARLGSILEDPRLKATGLVVVALGVALLVGGIGSLLLVQKLGHRLDAYTSGPSKISKILNQLVASLRIVARGPKEIAIALGLSMVFHTGGIVFFTLLTRAIIDTDTPYSSIATVFPLGLLSMMLPISPAGLGVGHIAFERLFAAIGIHGGATVFNVFVLGQNGPCLFGAFPFLAMRRRGEIPAEAPAPPAPAS